MCGLPCLDLWEILLQRPCPLVVHEDNQAMLRVIETGRNPTMRYLGRTHRVSVSGCTRSLGASIYAACMRELT